MCLEASEEVTLSSFCRSGRLLPSPNTPLLLPPQSLDTTALHPSLAAPRLPPTQ